MMSKSILRRLFFHFFLLGCLIGAGVYYFYLQDPKSVPLNIFGAAMGTFLILYLLSVYSMIVKPMSTIQKEMQALLTGRPFKKIFSTRTDEIGVLAYFFNKITDSLHKISGTVREEKRMSDELSIAAQLQKDILPEKPPSVPGLEITAKTRSAVEVGGDNFDFVQYDKGSKTLMYIGDVTGHGVPAALVMSITHTLISIFSELCPNIYQIVVNVNKHLKSRIRSTMFMTMLMLNWDHEAQKMTYVGAGHEHLLVYRSDSGECDSIMAGGIALGMVPDNSKIVKEQTLDLKVGDVVVLYTDGIVEAKNEAGEMFGLDRLKAALQHFAPEYSSEGISFHTASEFSRFVGKAEQADDITLFVVKFVGLGNEKTSTSMVFGEGDDK